MVCKAVGRVPMAPCPYGHVPTSTGAVVSAGGMGQQVWVLKPFAAHPQNRNISTYKRAREGKKNSIFSERYWQSRKKPDSHAHIQTHEDSHMHLPPL